MHFSHEQVVKVASLARLTLSEVELDALAGQLASISEYIEQLNEVDTTGVEPLAHCTPVTNVFREDVRRPSLSIDDALANAPKRAGEFYSVPSILE